MNRAARRGEVTATALDGSGRRLHIADGTEMHQAESPFGASELILMGADGGMRSVPYRAGAANPFG
jgi:hypothetical protein